MVVATQFTRSSLAEVTYLLCCTYTAVTVPILIFVILGKEFRLLHIPLAGIETRLD